MNIYKKLTGYFSSHHIVYKCSYHIILVPKYRKDILCGDVETFMKQLIIDISKNMISLYIKKNYLWGGKFWNSSSFISTVGSVSL